MGFVPFVVYEGGSNTPSVDTLQRTTTVPGFLRRVKKEVSWSPSRRNVTGDPNEWTRGWWIREEVESLP